MAEDLPLGEMEIPLESFQLRQQVTIQLDGSYPAPPKQDIVKVAKQYIAVSNHYGFIVIIEPKGALSLLSSCDHDHFVLLD